MSFVAVMFIGKVLDVFERGTDIQGLDRRPLATKPPFNRFGRLVQIVHRVLWVFGGILDVVIAASKSRVAGREHFVSRLTKREFVGFWEPAGCEEIERTHRLKRTQEETQTPLNS